jgi:hypothetical protein
MKEELLFCQGDFTIFSILDIRVCYGFDKNNITIGMIANAFNRLIQAES